MCFRLRSLAPLPSQKFKMTHSDWPKIVFQNYFFSIFRKSVILTNFNENCEPLKAAIHDNVESAKLIRKFQEPGEVEYDEFAKKYAVDINVRQIRLPEIFYLVFWPFMLKEKYLDQTLGHKVGYLQ